MKENKIEQHQKHLKHFREFRKSLEELLEIHTRYTPHNIPINNDCPLPTYLTAAAIIETTKSSKANTIGISVKYIKRLLKKLEYQLIIKDDPKIIRSVKNLLDLLDKRNYVKKIRSNNPKYLFNKGSYLYNIVEDCLKKYENKEDSICCLCKKLNEIFPIYPPSNHNICYKNNFIQNIINY